MARFFSALKPAWIEGYDKNAFGRDALAALILSVLLIPQAMAYAQLAGLEPSAGLFTAMVAPLAYAALGRSAAVSMGPVALASLLVAGATANVDVEVPIAAAIIAIETGMMLAALSLLRMGRLVNFISEPALLGFTAAAAFLIAASQLPGLTGIEADRSSTLQGALAALWNGGALRTDTLIVGVLALIGFFIAEPLLRRLALVLRMTGTRRLAMMKSAQAVVIVLVTVLAAYALPDVERITAPEGRLPAISAPMAPLTVWVALLVPSLTVAIVIFVTGIAVAKSLASRQRQAVDTNGEAMAIGAANLAAGVAGGYAAGVSLSRSALVHDVGGRSPLSSALAALIILPVALFATPILTQLPVAVLSALVISAVVGLVKWNEIKDVAAHSRLEALVIAATFLGTVALGVQWGLLVGALAGIAGFLWSSSLPNVIREEQTQDDAGQEVFRPVDDEDDQKETGEFLIVQIDRPLFFGNVGHAEEQVSRLVSLHPEARCLIMDMSAVTDVDATGLRMLTRLLDNVEERDLEVSFAELQPLVAAALEAQKSTARCSQFLTVQEAVRALNDRFDGGKNIRSLSDQGRSPRARED